MIDRVIRRHHQLLLALAALFGVTALGGDCGKKHAAPDATATSSSTGTSCAEYCTCMASTCSSTSFSPTCLEYCELAMSRTATIAKMDLGCRVAACRRAKSKNAEPECLDASGSPGASCR
jgi:hypothetical protein